MIAFVLSLVLAPVPPADDVPPVLLAPPIADLALFPDDAACNQQIIAWRRHLHWLAICEGLAPRHHRAQYQRWQRQTRDLSGLLRNCYGSPPGRRWFGPGFSLPPFRASPACRRIAAELTPLKVVDYRE